MELAHLGERTSAFFGAVVSMFLLQPYCKGGAAAWARRCGASRPKWTPPRAPCHLDTATRPSQNGMAVRRMRAVEHSGCSRAFLRASAARPALHPWRIHGDGAPYALRDIKAIRRPPQPAGSTRSATCSATTSRHCYHNSLSKHHLLEPCCAPVTSDPRSKPCARPFCPRCCHSHQCQLILVPARCLERRVSAFRSVRSLLGDCLAEGEAAVCACTARCFSPPPCEGITRVPSSARRPGAHLPVPRVFCPPSSPSPVFSSSLHSFFTTSSSPIRFSGHILCSFSQVR